MELNLKNTSLLLLIFLLIFLGLQIISLKGFYQYEWDENVYFYMGENIISGGEKGFLENLRPLLLPMIISPFSYHFLAKRAFILLISISTIFLFYKIGVNTKKPETMFFIFFLALFPYYFYTSTRILTEIPSLFFHGLSILFFLRKKYFFTGLFASLAFFTRFTFGIYLPILFIGMYFFNKHNLKKFLYFISGGIVTTPLLLINIFLFRFQESNILKAAFFPMLNQWKDHSASVYLWLYDKGIYFYFTKLLNWSIGSLLLIIGAIVIIKLFFKKYKTEEDRKNIFFFFLFLFPFLYLIITPHKEIRYFMLVLPWTAYLMTVGLSKVISFIRKTIKNRYLKKVTILLFISIILIHTTIGTFNGIKEIPHYPEDFYLNYLAALNNQTKNNTVLTSNAMIKTPAKIIPGHYNYYYFYDMISNNTYDYVYYNSNDFPCNDVECNEVKREIKDILKQNYSIYLNYTTYDSFYIYTSLE